MYLSFCIKHVFMQRGWGVHKTFFSKDSGHPLPPPHKYIIYISCLFYNGT